MRGGMLTLEGEDTGARGGRGDLGSAAMSADVEGLPPASDVTVAAARLSVRRWGDPAAPVVLYVHHLGVAGGTLHPHELASALAARGYHVVAYDQPGFGGSPALAPE